MIQRQAFSRGVVSLLSVLVPLGYIPGFTGYPQIPLDFGIVNSTAIFLVTVSLITFLPTPVTLFQVGKGQGVAGQW